jgi:adenine deaminase
MDRVIREVIASGVEPVVAYRWATLVGARHYHLKDLGAIAPGYYADILLLSSLEEVKVSDVIASGKPISTNGELTEQISEPPVTVGIKNSMNFYNRPTRETFMIHVPIENGKIDVNTIVLLESGLTELQKFSIPVENHYLKINGTSDDLCYLSVVPRHGQTHLPKTVLLSGLHLQRGAIASTISHDSHNLLIAGHNPDDMLLAALELEKCGGGVIFVEGGRVLGKLELPVAGLMSPKPVEALAEEITVMNQIGRKLGLTSATPILAISGFALPVLPEVRLTDKVGLLDTIHQKEIDLFVVE